MLLNKAQNWLKSSINLVLTVLVCGLLFISNAYPAQATTSKPTDGEVSLNKIQAKTENVARSNPRGIDEIIDESRNGLNGVQGAADKNKMISPEDTNATTVEDQAVNLLDNLFN